jgi:hypothetical protein
MIMVKVRLIICWVWGLVLDCVASQVPSKGRFACRATDCLGLDCLVVVV